MYQLTDLSKEAQSQLEAFTAYLHDLNKYSITIARDIPTAVINFLGYLEHIEKTPLEQADAGHLSQYIQYLRSMLKEHAELWAKRILALPLDMFLNFLYAEGYCPSDPVRAA